MTKFVTDPDPFLDHFDPIRWIPRSLLWHKSPMLDSVENYREFLQQELVRRCNANPRYSQRAFARQLGLSPGELSEILRQKRPLGAKAALRVARGLGLTQEETKRLLLWAQLQRGELQASSLGEAPTAPTQLALDLFAVVSDWYCFALLNLTECTGFRWSEPWIAKRLGITQAEVHLAITRLKRIGLLEIEKGKLVVAKDYEVAPGSISSEAVRNYHKQILAKASAALDLQKPSEREITGVSFPFDPASVAQLKKEVASFLAEMAKKYGKGARKREVFHLEMALFKLSSEVSSGR